MYSWLFILLMCEVSSDIRQQYLPFKSSFCSIWKTPPTDVTAACDWLTRVGNLASLVTI